MGKKKKGRSRKGRRKRAAPKSDRAMPLGLGGGALLSGVDIFYAPLTYLLAKQYDNAKTTLKNNAVNIDNYKMAGAGLIISASPKIPVVRILAKPADKAIRRLSKGKVSM